MSSITASQSGLAVLTQQGTGLLSNAPLALSSSALKTASKEDVAHLSAAAVQLQQRQVLLGLSTSQIPNNPVATAAALQKQLSGDNASSDNTTPSTVPTGKAAVAFQQASQVQQIQSLFSPFYQSTNGNSINFLA